MTKTQRQDLLKNLILEHEFDTQNDLVDFLNKKGLKVTQATISRDIKELGVVKVKGTIKKFKYTIIQNTENFILYNNTIKDIVTAQNIVVVKTLEGTANSVCIVIDKSQINGILGTVAGDDTIIIVTPNNEEANQVAKSIKRIVKWFLKL